MRIHVKLILSVLILSVMLPAIRASASTDGIVQDTKTNFADEGEEIYDHLKERMQERSEETIERLTSNNGLPLKEDFGKRIWVSLFYVHDVLSSITPSIVILSFLSGVLITLLSTKNKKRQKFALRVLCLGIPVLLLIYDYAVPYMYLKFNI